MNPEILRSIEIFSGLSDEHLQAIAAHASERSVPAGTRVVAQGDYSTDLISIIEGEAEVVRDDKVVSTMGAGATFGEIGVVEKVQRTASVVASTPMRLITLTSWDVKRIGLEVWFEISDQIDARVAA